MFNFLAGAVLQLAFLVSFDHKSDAIVFGGLLVLILSVRSIVKYGRQFNKKESQTPRSEQVIKRRELL